VGCSYWTPHDFFKKIVYQIRWLPLDFFENFKISPDVIPLKILVISYTFVCVHLRVWFSNILLNKKESFYFSVEIIFKSWMENKYLWKQSKKYWMEPGIKENSISLKNYDLLTNCFHLNFSPLIYNENIAFY